MIRTLLFNVLPFWQCLTAIHVESLEICMQTYIKDSFKCKLLYM